MSVANSGSFTRVTMAQSVRYGGLAPHGLAYGTSSVTGDATGGQISLAISSPGGFIYRLESFEARFSAGSGGTNGELQLRPDWLTSASPDQLANPAFAFPLIEFTESANALFMFRLQDTAYTQARRVPVGVSQQQLASPASELSLFSIIIAGQVNLATYQLQIVASWWPITVFTRPDFLMAFYESPTPLVVTA